jgi:hypothetical protein
MARGASRLSVSVALSLLLLVLAKAALSQPAEASQEPEESWFDEPIAVEQAEPVSEPPALPRPRPLAEPAEERRAQASASRPDDTEEADPRVIRRFVRELEPHGLWVEHHRYGLVWVPHRHVVGAEFVPYVTSGYWAVSASGDYVWVSDLPGSTIVYHYGRWLWVEDMGWVWVPGSRYASSWVVWRVSLGTAAYVGWAPAPPVFIWVRGYPVYYRYHYHPTYVYVPRHRVLARDVWRHEVRDPVRRRNLDARSLRVPAEPRLGAARGPTFRSASPPDRRAAQARVASPSRLTPAPQPASPAARTPAQPTRQPSSRPAPQAPQPDVAPPRRSVGPTPAWRAPAQGDRMVPPARAVPRRPRAGSR